MVLINIDQLSDSELAYIAEQENLKGSEKLSRQDLIEALEEIYDGEEIRFSGDKKFVKSLTDVDSDVLQLPGVEPLPENFNSNEIHMIMKDSDWAYVIWDIDNNTRNKIDNENARLFIRTVAIQQEDKEELSYEVEVGNEDKNWNIELPWRGRTYRLELLARSTGKSEVIATSETESIPQIFMKRNPEILKTPDKTKICLSAMTSKEGYTEDNGQVFEILENMKKEAAK